MKARIFVLLTVVAATLRGAETPAAPPEVRHFDFWVGDWEVFDRSRGFKIGDNHIELIESGRVLLERWRDVRGGTGVSISAYDAANERWQQTWMAASGKVNNSYGGLREGAMVLTTAPSGFDRCTWTPQPDGTVRQQIEQSADGGKSWQTMFDGVYRRKSAAATPASSP